MQENGILSNIEGDSILRLNQIIGSKAAQQGKKIKADAKIVYAPLLPISKSTWYAGVKNGRYPQPIKLGQRSVGWRASDIAAVIRGTQS